MKRIKAVTLLKCNTARDKGFTLVELLVVIAIISLLSSVVLASVNEARESAEKTARLQAAKEVQKALEAYHLDGNPYPDGSGSLDNLQVLVDENYISSLPNNDSPYAIYYRGPNNDFRYCSDETPEENEYLFSIYWGSTDEVDNFSMPYLKIQFLNGTVINLKMYGCLSQT